MARHLMIRKPMNQNLAGWSRGGGFNHLTAVILAARTTNMVRALQFAAIRAFSVGSGDQGMGRTPHSAPRLGGFLFRNSHRQDSLL
jgi:hypothetical protein